MGNLFNWSEPQVFSFFFVLVRVSSLLFFLPILGDRAVPPPIKILFAVALSWVAFPLVWGAGLRLDPHVMDSPSKLAWAVACDAAFGMMVGFAARWIFDAVQTGGHIIGTTVGFSIATVLDPHTESQTIALSELQYLLVALLFLGLNGHHIYLSAILQSFKIVPLAGVDLLANGDSVIQYLIQMSSEVIVLGFKLAAPAVVVILIINLAFGIMARAVPNMNVMAVSFTANIMVGLLVVLTTLPGFVNMVGGAFDSYTPELLKFMRLFAGG